MRMTTLWRASALAVFALAYGLCAGSAVAEPDKAASKVTKANADKIKAGMTLKEVEDILGTGKEMKASDFPAARTAIQQRLAQRRQQVLDNGGKALKWEDGKKAIILVFTKEDKVAITSTQNLGADPAPANPDKN